MKMVKVNSRVKEAYFHGSILHPAVSKIMSLYGDVFERVGWIINNSMVIHLGCEPMKIVGQWVYDKDA